MITESETKPPTFSAPPQADLGSLPSQFGFKGGICGAHASRTIMLAELTALLAAAPENVDKDAYIKLIVDENCLGKRTSSNRRLTAKHLAELYGLNPSVTLFRLLRFFWKTDPQGRPLLAVLCTCARDPILRQSFRCVAAAKAGDILTSANFVDALNEDASGRYTPATRLSIAQNVAASWTQGGFFEGRIKKVRRHPVVTPAAAAYALCLGFLCGLRGQYLLDSFWARLLDVSTSQVSHYAQEASRRGWLDFRGIGRIVDISFRHLLTEGELQEVHGSH